MLTVGQYEDGALDAAHEFLDDDTAGGVAEHTAEHLLQFLLGFVQCRQDEHTLACAQAVGLQNVRGFQSIQKSQTLFLVLAVEGLVACGRDVVALHESLGKVLGAFEYGTGFRRAYDGDIRCALVLLQIVVDALHQRVFWADDHHIDAFLNNKLLDGFEVVGLHGHVFAAVAGAGVTWSDIQFLTLL